MVVVGLNLGLDSLGKSDHTAGDTFALTFSVTTFTALNRGVLSLVVVILSLVNNHGAANNGVGSAKLNEHVSVLVLGTVVPASLDLLDVTNSALVDVKVRLTLVGSEGVEHLTGRLTAVFEVTELGDLEGVEAWVETFELSNDGGEITFLLSEGKSALRVGVTEEIELASGDNGLLWLFGSFPVGVNGVDVVCLDITGSLGGATHPWESV